MEWNRSITFTLASMQCTQCRGIGTKTVGRDRRVITCACVARKVFRECLDKFRTVSTSGRENSPLRRTGNTWYRAHEEFLADFIGLAQQTLNEADYKLFKYHFLLGADYNLCTRKLGLNKGNFFHAVYRIEAALGRAFVETKPYGIYPLHAYFGKVSDAEPVKPLQPPPAARRMPVRPPLRTIVVADDRMVA
jgi:hypothetical protein